MRDVGESEELREEGQVRKERADTANSRETYNKMPVWDSKHVYKIRSVCDSWIKKLH